MNNHSPIDDPRDQTDDRLDDHVTPDIIDKLRELGKGTLRITEYRTELDGEA